MPTIARQLSDNRPGAKVYEFSNDAPERGGHDPDLPQIIYPVQVRGRPLVGHTRDLADPGAPIWIDPIDTIYPSAQAADLRCLSCVAKVNIGQFGDGTLAVIGHQTGCTWLAEMLRLSGLAS